MRDFDFDELDRAVSSALNKKSDKKPTTQSAQPTTNTANSEEAKDSKTLPSQAPAKKRVSAHAVHTRVTPSNVTSRLNFAKHSEALAPIDANTEAADATPDVKPVQSTAPSPTPSPTRRRRIPHTSGRAMDVVAPQQARRSMNVRPFASANDLQTAAPETPAQTPAPTQSPVESPVKTANEGSLAAAMNALLADEDSAEPALVEAEAPVPTTVAPTPAPIAEVDLEPATDEPESTASYSPFLVDTKIEKRPLGAASSTASPAELNTATLLPAEAAPVETELTTLPPEEESQPDLIAIESGSQPIVEETPQPEAPEPVAESKPETAAPKPTTSTGPTSIAQQYKAPKKIASEDDEAGTIFDPQSYAQPLESDKVKKKSSPVVWIVIVLVAALIGAGIGAVLWLEGVAVPL